MGIPGLIVQEPTQEPTPSHPIGARAVGLLLRLSIEGFDVGKAVDDLEGALEVVGVPVGESGSIVGERVGEKKRGLKLSKTKTLPTPI